ncbi:MAG TPA: UbiA-like polyprenyltransferase [Saprospiraceae bacterium]|nr:UbiA-like polyprenyltransferase [Saprospiraceae bacterium]HNT18858.1 UbiA-like polyprenyltransferase [Saprospiraceae bacterium]
MKSYLSLIKFSHTVFALPFAAVGTVLAFKAGYALDWLLGLKILLCMVFARSAAMAFNRWADERYDRLNPRTAGREIPAGRVTSHEALWMTLISSLAFVVTTWSINSICFYLSPLALLTILGYSYTKRWTAICHLILGGGLALAPIGSYLAVTGIFSLIPLLYSGVVFYWVSGFDIIYALQDEEFDKVHRLHSIPARFGKSKALKISRLLHFISAMILFFASWLIHNRYESSGVWLWLSALVFVSMLIYQQNLVKPGDLSKINLAFFTTNGLASVIYGVLFSMDLLF